MSRDLNPGQLVEKHECFLSAMPCHPTPTNGVSRHFYLIKVSETRKKSFRTHLTEAENFQGVEGVGPGLFRRFQLPKSSKYDTYRLRSRTSVVEENLFGEPLKNKVRDNCIQLPILSLESKPQTCP